jgi:hypothetical protein
LLASGKENRISPKDPHEFSENTSTEAICPFALTGHVHCTIYRTWLVGERSFGSGMMGSRGRSTIQEMLEIGVSIRVQFAPVRGVLGVKAMGDFPSIRYPVVVGVSACFAWIDGWEATNLSL